MKFKLSFIILLILIVALLGYVFLINDRVSLIDIRKAISEQGLEVTVGDFKYNDVVLINSKQHMIAVNPPTGSLEKP